MKISKRATITVFFLAANVVLAQDSRIGFEGITDGVASGDSVRITYKGGKTVKGKIESIDGNLLRLKGKEVLLETDSIERLQKKRKDPWWNGFLIGAGSGAAGGLIATGTTCHNDSECSAIAGVIFVPAGIGIGMAVGSLIDRSITKYDTVFENSHNSAGLRLRISPEISHEQRGVNVSFAF